MTSFKIFHAFPAIHFLSNLSPSNSEQNRSGYENGVENSDHVKHVCIGGSQILSCLSNNNIHVFSLTPTPTHTHTHTYTHIHTHTHTCKHTHTHSLSHLYTHTHSHTHTLSGMHATPKVIMRTRLILMEERKIDLKKIYIYKKTHFIF